MIRAVESKAIPYVLEDDRESPLNDQTVFWIRPKTGADNNKTLQRYSLATKENRKGFREIDPRKMNIADQEEFLSVVERVENFGFNKENPMYAQFEKEEGIVKDSTEPAVLKEIVRSLSADYLAEVLEVSNNISKLTEGAKKNSNS
jgi:hypothetical protein